MNHNGTPLRDRVRDLMRASAEVDAAEATAIAELEREAEFNIDLGPVGRDHDDDARWLRRGATTGASILFDAPPPEPEWVVGDALLFRGGVSLLVAPWKCGKTFAAFALAVDVVAAHHAPGRRADFLGSPVLGAGPTLYLSAEGGAALLRPRLERLGAVLGRDALRDLTIWTGEAPTQPGAVVPRTFTRRPNLTSRRDIADAYSWAQDLGSVLVVWDPLLRFWRLDRERMADESDRLMDALQEESERANVATLATHHEAKGAGDEDAAVSSGRESGRLGDDVSGAVVNLKTNAHRTRTTAHFVVRHGPPIEKRRVELDRDTLRFVVVEDEERGAATPGPDPKVTTDAVLAVLRDRGGEVSRDSLAASLRVSPDRMRHLWPNLVRDLEGVARQVGGKRGAPLGLQLTDTSEGAAS